MLVVLITIGLLVAGILASGISYAVIKHRAARGIEGGVLAREVVWHVQETAQRNHHLCPSAAPVPDHFESVRAVHYQSAPSDWKDDPGWACLGYEYHYAQEVQLQYLASGNDFTVIAEGDLDGDGKRSHYEIRGTYAPATNKVTIDQRIVDLDRGE